jgi:hypothetical protein
MCRFWLRGEDLNLRISELTVPRTYQLCYPSKVGAFSRSCTRDRLITNQLLCWLSYEGLKKGREWDSNPHWDSLYGVAC